jgi:hypothetical protein
MVNATDFFKIEQALSNGGFFEKWIPVAQRFALKELIKGEEGDFFVERLKVIKKCIEEMPQTYGQDGVKDPIAYLKYFGGPVTAYITEKDKGEDGDWTPSVDQIQAYGQVEILPNYPERGYIGIQELIEAGVELDLHFEPVALSALKD